MCALRHRPEVSRAVAPGAEMLRRTLSLCVRAGGGGRDWGRAVQCSAVQGCHPGRGGAAVCRGASEGKGPQRPSQRRLGRRLEEVAKAVGGGYCRLQMPLRLALVVRGGQWLGIGWAPWRGLPPHHPMHPSGGGGGGSCPPVDSRPVGGLGPHTPHTPTDPRVGAWPEGPEAPRGTQSPEAGAGPPPSGPYCSLDPTNAGSSPTTSPSNRRTRCSSPTDFEVGSFGMWR